MSEYNVKLHDEIKVRLNDFQMRLMGVYVVGLSYVIDGLKGVAIIFAFVLMHILGEVLAVWVKLRKGAERDE